MSPQSVTDTRWIPARHLLPNGEVCGSLLASGEHWQIYWVGPTSRLLVAERGLVARWVDARLLERDLLFQVTVECDEFDAILSANRVLCAVTAYPSPSTKAEAMSFAASIRESRELIGDTSLHDAIYVDQFGRLLPTYTVSEGLTDAEVLGRWLTGGVEISAISLRRLSALVSWLDAASVREIVECAGVKVTPVAVTAVESGLGRGGENRQAGDRPPFELPGRRALQRFFVERIIKVLSAPASYERFGVGFPAPVVLHGPPGCGKTYAVERLVEYLDLPLFSIDSASVASPYIHETSRKVAEVFETAAKSAPAVVVIDEMDAYLPQRGGEQASRVEEVTEFLRQISKAPGNQVLVLGMTNRLETIDVAVRRRGRFEHEIEVGAPSMDEVKESLAALLAPVPTDEKLDLRRAISALSGRPMSDIAFLVKEAAQLAARAKKRVLDQECLDRAIGGLPSADTRSSRRIGF